MTEHHDVIIVGGGQAGLAMSYHLKQCDVDHVVLEAGQIGETWRTQRWDSFCLVTPNWTMQLPGAPYDGPDPDGFMLRDEIVHRLERYRERFQLPVKLGVRVTRVEQDADGYAIVTAEGTMRARQVVISAGAFPRPLVLPMSARIPKDILQLHTHEYRNPAQLPQGAVLVVGSGQSGAQIAEELLDAGRKVYLSLGSCGRAPRRYRGHDIVWWLLRVGATERRVQDLPDLEARFACKPHFSGQGGGHDIDLRELAGRGMVLLGRLKDASGGKLTLAKSANESLDKADAFARKILDDIDAYITANGLDIPTDPERARLEGGHTQVPEVPSLDLHAAGITSVIWATGFRPEFPWVQVPVFSWVLPTSIASGPIRSLASAMMRRILRDTSPRDSKTDGDSFSPLVLRHTSLTRSYPARARSKGRCQRMTQLASLTATVPDQEQSEKLCIILSKGTLDMVYPAFIIAQTAAVMGREVHVFFTFWGMDAVTTKKYGKLSVSSVGNPGLPMPNILGVIPGMTAMTTWMMRGKMAKAGVKPLPDLIRECVDLGVELHACSTTLEVMGVAREDLIPEVKDVVGAASMLEFGDGGQTIFI